MTEKQMVFWNARKLSGQYGISQIAICRLMKAIGANRWSGGHGRGTTWYWDPEETGEKEIRDAETGERIA